MKDFLDLILQNLTRYVPVLVAMTTAPNRTAEDLVEDPDRLEKALLFGGITAFVGFVLQAPLLQPEDEFIVLAGSMLVLKILAILMFSFVILVSFRVVGCRGPFDTTLPAYLYVVSPLYLLFIVLDMINIGVLSTHNPQWALDWRSGNALTADRIDEFFEAVPLKASLFTILALAQLLATPVWFAICWRTFKKIFQASVPRSAFAFLISGLGCYAIFQLSVFIMRGLYGGTLPFMY